MTQWELLISTTWTISWCCLEAESQSVVGNGNHLKLEVGAVCHLGDLKFSAEALSCGYFLWSPNLFAEWWLDSKNKSPQSEWEDVQHLSPRSEMERQYSSHGQEVDQSLGDTGGRLKEFESCQTLRDYHFKSYCQYTLAGNPWKRISVFPGWWK